MNYKKIFQELDGNRLVYKGLLENKSKEEYLWKPKPDTWCLLEIVCHLRDEEIEDFRARANSVLENPELDFTQFDPVSWVNERNYIEQNYNEILNFFLQERDKSISWLQGLTNPKWDNYYIHPKAGPLTAKFFLSNWLAHDYLHIRQILNLKYEYLKYISGDVLDYAGDW